MKMAEKTIQELAQGVMDWNRKNTLKSDLNEFLKRDMDIISTLWDECLAYNITPLIFKNSGDDKKINFRLRAVVDDMVFNVVVHHDNTYEIEVDT